MIDANLELKRRHAALAERAMRNGRHDDVAAELARVAAYTLNLADRTGAQIRLNYLIEASSLLRVAEGLGKRAAAGDPGMLDSAPPANRRPGGDGSGAGAANHAEGKINGRFELVERPETRLEDVIGMEEVKAALRRQLLNHFVSPEAFAVYGLRPGGGILLYGLPGNGKTYIARALAGSCDAAFIVAQAAALRSKWVGETEKNIRALFDCANQFDRVVIFCDEVTQLFGRAGNIKVNAVDEFLRCMDGFERRKNAMLFIGATNTPHLLPESVCRPGRLGTHIYVPPPDEPARAGIFADQFKAVPVARDVEFDDLGRRTDGYSAAEIVGVCDHAKGLAVDRHVELKAAQEITLADLEDGQRHVKPRTRPEDIERLKAWARRDAGQGGNGGDDDED